MQMNDLLLQLMAQSDRLSETCDHEGMDVVYIASLIGYYELSEYCGGFVFGAQEHCHKDSICKLFGRQLLFTDTDMIPSAFSKEGHKIVTAVRSSVTGIFPPHVDVGDYVISKGSVKQVLKTECSPLSLIQVGHVDINLYSLPLYTGGAISILPDDKWVEEVDNSELINYFTSLNIV